MGLLLGVFAAFTTSAQNSFFRNSQGSDPFIVNWMRFLIAIPVLAILVPFFSPWIMPPDIFWIYLFFLSLPLELLLAYCSVRAFQYSPQSKIGPLFSLSTLFLIPLGFLFLREVPSVLGFLGVLSIAVGSFFLGWEDRKPLAGFKNIFKEKGSRFILAAAFFAAMGVIIGKFLFQYMPPLEFAFFSVISLFIAHSVILLFKKPSAADLFRPSFFALGFVFALGQVFHYIGLSLLLAVYFISLKRLSIVFDVLLGVLIFKEEHFHERMVGALFMIAGVLLIVFG